LLYRTILEKLYHLAYLFFNEEVYGNSVS